GRVTGVASHGLYVTLDEHDVNGLVPIASLGSSLIYDEGRNALIARRSGANYALGDTMRVELEEVNLARAWIRFLPIDSDGNVARGRPTGRPAGKPGVRGRGGASARSKGGASGNRGAASRGKSSATRGKGSASRGKGPASRDKDEASETAKTGAKPVRRTKRRARPKGAPTPDKTRR
ncbi:MAG: ribonuclease R, partial [Myxococcota bacterium]